MKKFLIMLCLGGACMAGKATAQIGISVNIGAQPVWGPVGYDHVDYYYIPDIDAYYDVSRNVYVYQEGPRWVTTVGLPPRYHNFDIYHAHKVVINGTRNPWMHNATYRTRYARYRGMHDQTIIRDSHEPRYYENPGHPRHNEWHGRPDNHMPPGHMNNPGHMEHGNPGHMDHGNHGNPGGGHDDHGNHGGGHDDHGHGH